MQTLRLITYLAPGIPLEFFELLARVLGRGLGAEVALRVECRASGPSPDDPDPFATGEADIGCMCSPSFLWLSDNVPSPVELVPAGAVFDDPRSDGRPVLFSEVVVGPQTEARSFEELQGLRWAYNDACSMSGYFNLLEKLDSLGQELDYFGEFVRSGSHHESVRLVESGRVDAAAIDSNVLRHIQKENPGLRLRILESWGPFPIQPLVVRAELPAAVKRRIAETLLGLHEHPEFGSTLSELGVTRFAPIAPDAYEEERKRLFPPRTLSRDFGI